MNEMNVVERQPGNSFTVGEGQTLTIGRKSENKVAFPDNRDISRSHAEVSLNGGILRITDLESSNGTFVNNVKIPTNTPTPIRANNEIRFGKTVAYKVVTNNGGYEFVPIQVVIPQEVTTSTVEAVPEVSKEELNQLLNVIDSIPLLNANVSTLSATVLEARKILLTIQSGIGRKMEEPSYEINLKLAQVLNVQRTVATNMFMTAFAKVADILKETLVASGYIFKSDENSIYIFKDSKKILSIKFSE